MREYIMKKENGYTAEELELITGLGMGLRPERTAELLASKVGDMDFNDRLMNDNNASQAEPAKRFLKYYTYKTRNIKDFSAMSHKLDIVLELDRQNLPVAKHEKISLSEYSKILELGAVKDKFGSLLEDIEHNSQNKEFKKIYAEIEKADQIAQNLNEKALQTKDYKSGDLMMYLTSKTSALGGGRQRKYGHEGKFEEKLITKYNHAAPIYIDRSNPDKPIITKSDVWSQQRTDVLTLGEILESNAFRIDPTKLVRKNMIEKLEKVDYGYRTGEDGKDLVDANGNKIKITWQDAMKLRYEQLSDALHLGQIPYQIEELKKQKERLLSSGEEVGVDKIREFIRQISQKEEMLIQNDQFRLRAGHWLNPKTLLEGHQQWFSKNDFRDLSNKMFNATPDEREMICSEYAARSIISVTDQLNRLTSIDLQVAGLIENEEKIIKDPIPKNENFKNLHPERLVNLLEKSGSVKKIENSYLKNLMRLEDVSKTRAQQNMDYTTNLPKSIYSILNKAKDCNEFKDQSTKVIEVYLKATKIEDKIIEQAEGLTLKNQLDDIYKQYTKKPEGILEKIGHVCIKVFEFCGVLTKDKGVKQNIDNMIKDFNKNINTSGQDKAINQDDVVKPRATLDKQMQQAGALLNTQSNSQISSDRRVTKVSEVMDRRSRDSAVGTILPQR